MNSFEEINKAKEKLPKLEKLMHKYRLEVHKTGNVRPNLGISAILALSLLIDELNKELKQEQTPNKLE